MLEEHIRSLEHIDLLINNAGFGLDRGIYPTTTGKVCRNAPGALRGTCPAWSMLLSQV